MKTLFLALTGLLSSVVASTPLFSTYYPEYNAQYLAPADVPYTKLNDISYFVAVPNSDGSLQPLNDSVAKPVVQYAHEHGVKVTLVVGGWTGSQYFSSIVATAVGRQNFLNHILATMKSYNFDGLQIDWEFPGTLGVECNEVSDNDVSNLLAFFQLARTALGPSRRLSSAVSVNGLTNTPNVKPFADVLTDVMLMTYDILGPGWTNVTGPNAPLQICDANYIPVSVQSAVQLWRQSGMPANKIVLGLPAYGYGYAGVPNHLVATKISKQETSYAFQSYTGPIGGVTADQAGPDQCGVEQPNGGQWLYKELISDGFLAKTYTRGGRTFTRYFDSCTQTPFLYSAKKGVILAYDDPQSIGAKTKFARSAGLGGFAFFDATGDYGTQLLDAARAPFLAKRRH